MQQMVIYCKSILSQHVSGIFMPIVRRTDCVPLPMVVCPVVAVVMLESRVASCVLCVENVVWGNLVGLTLIYLSKMRGHSNIKCFHVLSPQRVGLRALLGRSRSEVVGLYPAYDRMFPCKIIGLSWDSSAASDTKVSLSLLFTLVA